jgi:hypothetical protein
MRYVRRVRACNGDEAPVFGSKYGLTTFGRVLSVYANLGQDLRGLSEIISCPLEFEFGRRRLRCNGLFFYRVGFLAMRMCSPSVSG